MSPESLVMEAGLPTNTEAEEFVLGSILLDHRHAMPQAGRLTADDFAIEKHRRLFVAMQELDTEGADIDYLTLVNRLEKKGQLEAVGGIAAVAGLTDGLPRVENLSSYVEIVKEHARLRRVIFHGQRLITQAVEKQDSKELLAMGVNGLVEIDDAADQGFVKLGDAIEGDYEKLFGEDEEALPTDLTGLNSITSGGLRTGEYTIIGARPGSGKTAMALGFAAYLCRYDYPCLFFSLEMNRMALIMRLLSAHARVNLYRMRGNYLGPDEKERLNAALKDFDQWPLYIHDSSSITIEEISLIVRGVKKRFEPKVVFVDYVQLVGTRERYNSRVQQVTAISHGLMHLAKSQDVAVVALAQLSRASEHRPGKEKIPILSDLRESGDLENDAHLVILLHRPELYQTTREDLQGMAEAIVAKQRNGPTGTIKLAFLKQYAKFENLAEGYGDEEEDEEGPPF